MQALTKFTKILFCSFEQNEIPFEQNEIHFEQNEIPFYENYCVFGTLLYKNDTEHIVSIDEPKKFCELVKTWTGTQQKEKHNVDGVARWFTKNRIEDKARSHLIAESIKNKAIVTTTTLYISELVQNDTLRYLCWDGQHRRGAIKLLQDDIESYDFIKLKYKCHIYKNDTREGIIRKFMEINMSVPVPQTIVDFLETELTRKFPTMEDTNNERIKQIADTISIELNRIYSEYSRPSNSPMLPNFNMNNVNQDIMNYLKEYDIIYTAQELLHYIELLNTSLEEKYNSKKLNKQLSKRLERVNSHQKKCYLFIESDNFIPMLNEFIV